MEDAELRFATPGSHPLLIATPKNAVTYMWPWGAALEPIHDYDTDYWMSWETFEEEDYHRDTPSMTYATERLNGPPEYMSAGESRYYSCFWALMQTAAAPAGSVLPRRVKRGLERRIKGSAKGTPIPNLWIVDVPRALPNPEPVETPGSKHSYRYPVRGHWRNQWYPSVQGNKPIWIAEHIRGPQTAPLHDARVEWAKEHPVCRLRIPSANALGQARPRSDGARNAAHKGAETGSGLVRLPELGSLKREQVLCPHLV